MSAENGQKPIPSPGDYIRAELEKRSWGQADLARVLNRSLTRVSELVLGKQSVSPEIAVALSAALGETPSEWLRRESAYRLSLEFGGADDVRRRARIYELAPIKEIQKRGWIRPGDDMAIIEQDLLKFFDISSLEEEPAIHGAMRKTGLKIAASPPQRAWAFCVRKLAKAIPADAVGKYDESKLDACKLAMRKLAAYSAEVRKVPSLLMSYGIRFVVAEGLPGAKMDGFATWLNDCSPVIGMSLRFDRLDNYWFTLGHELSHIKNRDEAPIDGDVSGDDEYLEVKSAMERRADAESAAMFISPDDLESFIRRVGPLYSTERINQFANSIKMHPSIIIGQLKNRGQIGPSRHTKTNVPIRDAIVKVAVTDGWGKSLHPGVIE